MILILFLLFDSSLFFLQESGFELVMTYKTWGEGYDLLKEEIQKDREGYVVKFKNGFRMKIKGEEYKRLHKMVVNDKGIPTLKKRGYHIPGQRKVLDDEEREELIENFET